MPSIIAGSAILLLCAILAFCHVIHTMLVGSDAYKLAVDRAHHEPRVIDALGSPVVEGYWVMGEIELRNDSGTAGLKIPLKGARDDGALYVAATKTNGVWHLDEAYVKVESDGHSIMLVEPPAPPGPERER